MRVGEIRVADFINKKAFLFLGLCQVLLLFNVFNNYTMINNGDYWRVTHNLIDLPPWSVLEECPRIEFSAFIPTSSLSLMLQVSTWLSLLAGFSCFSLKGFALILCVAFCSGSLMAALVSKKNFRLILATTIVALCFSHLFNSLYEEALAIVLVPWVIYGFSRFSISGKWGVFFISVIGLLFTKAQMVGILPITLMLLVLLKRDGKIDLLLFLIMTVGFVMVSIFALYLKKENNVPNAYNRLYNGLGWSVMGVSSWGQNSFGERHNYFYKNRDHIKPRVEFADGELATLLGTSYWPTGSDIIGGKLVERVDSHHLTRSLEFSGYLLLLISKDVLPLVLTSVYSVALHSNYDIEYLVDMRTRQSFNFKLRSFAAKIAGFVFIMTIFYSIVRQTTSASIALSVLFGALPLFVVFGDGFYEFEKHMVPYFMVTPLLFLIGKRQAVE